jgi:hypothetical protein
MKNLICFILMSLPIFASASVWETEREWDSRAEADYQAWVAKNWERNFFAKPGFYKNVQMDCADTVYAMRLVYASENGLPFVMRDPTGGDAYISNEMNRWDDLGTESRKKAFLQFVYKVASTSSLPRDSYPVAVNRSAIGSGRFLLTDPASHHSWTVKYVSQQGIPFLLFSSRPARVQLFERFEFPTMGFLFPKGLRPETNAGFRAFRHPEDLGRPVWDVPGYSLEQYQIPLKGWSRQVQKKLALKGETGDQGLTRILGNACRGAQERVEMVTKSDALNARLGDRCFSATQFDDHSTPSRDVRLKGSFQELQSTYAKIVKAGLAISPTVLAQVTSVLNGDQAAGPNAFCNVRISRKKTLSLGQIYVRSMNNLLSSNPQDTLSMRWGLERSPSAKARSCPVY